VSAEITTLKNGLRVISDHMDTVETVSVGAWVDVGTRDEAVAINGISHVLEHMAFKGTKRRSAYQIAESIEAVGGHLNAYTSREHTAYYAKVLKEDTGLAVDIIGDILQHSTMEAGELAREQAVIVQEIHQAHDTPDDIIFDHFQETAFPDQAMGRPVLGTAERVHAMDRDTVLEYMADHYSPSKMIISAAGKIDHADLVNMVEESFNALPQGITATREKAIYQGGAFREVRDLEQVHLVLGFDGLSYNDPDFYAASVLSTLFGGGMSSRLFQEVREKRGLVYAIYSFMSCFTDGGIFGIYAGTGADEAPQLIPLIRDEIEKVISDVTEDEIVRARAQLKASILMSLESTSTRCEQMARQFSLFGRPIPTAETVEKVEAVDLQAIRRVAAKLFSGPATQAAIGPDTDIGVFAQLAS
jgi:predicted Zn-dependent peptidase